MRPDFNRMLYTTEDILWMGESSPNAKTADGNGRRDKYVHSVIWGIVGLVMIAACFANRYTGTDLIGGLAFAGVFILISVLMFRSARKFRHEYYCLTNERLIIADDKDKVITRELAFAKDAEITYRNGDYGSVLVFTARCTKAQYHCHFRGSAYDRTACGGLWCINGVLDYEELLEHLQRWINDPVNDINNLRQKIGHREYKDSAYAMEQEAEFRKQFARKYAKRIEKMKQRNEL